ncbi:aldehyde dehydrogenase family protein [Celeribacter indicus]|uniref:Aldehyde dehydrogenase n=1 Tax=Celeribacter indicus TaxID=1208324 RepID=A0A0B5DSQ6_9RHOB|nr:aldehyde dehydrogenase family protein [Celeribacter indicus]AJE46074.1 coniferyl aldehyde dehydrogenase [Celeribacter indicus]SDX44510.1 coniferyl-aldehyde dehydrogenase [Celeribacter indicus]
MAELSERFAAMRRAHALAPVVDLETRLNRIARLKAALLGAEEALTAAISADFSHRSAVESRVFDIDVTLAELEGARRNLARWMRVRRVRMPLPFRPARAEIRPQPLGVVGVISPWNYPVQLALAPLLAALAAGNRVMLKPSELTPRSARALAEMLAGAFAPEEVTTVEGDAEVAAAFAALPFDHLFFTGSTAVGRKVYEAAARNLTPVTLELGGKSPAVLMPSADLGRAARRIAWGKAANAGQTCVAPDYVLAPRNSMLPLAEALMGAFAAFYPEGPESDDYAAIVSDRHRDRLTALLEEARARGCKIFTLGEATATARKLAPAVVVDPPQDLALMREEIFGPILPLVPYDTPEEALALVASGDHPLALYVFAEDRAEADLWLERTLSGGAMVNDVMLHVGVETLPFGGVGASGIGAYHGRAGFERFSHMKSVMRQAKWNAMGLTEPPYTGTKRRLLTLTRRLR